ncbi:MAG TPA: flagellar basal body rod protein FlgC [Candidatus Dormibacteraeota bacterium]|nr:flagellar basal body rod protein FlgC [Candidatus Dormibacteraeota bacterium]
MNLFGVMTISGTALLAERERAEIVASNLANAETTRTGSGGPYQREHVVFAAMRPFGMPFGMQLASMVDFSACGVQVEGVVADPAPPIRRYEPGHPDADAQGYVEMPNINPIEEEVNLMGAARSYQANVSAVQATKNMISSALEILA